VPGTGACLLNEKFKSGSITHTENFGAFELVRGARFFDAGLLFVGDEVPLVDNVGGTSTNCPGDYVGLTVTREASEGTGIWAAA
jgi:hypothetical protein